MGSWFLSAGKPNSGNFVYVLEFRTKQIVAFTEKCKDTKPRPVVAYEMMFLIYCNPKCIAVMCMQERKG